MKTTVMVANAEDYSSDIVKLLTEFCEKFDVSVIDEKYSEKLQKAIDYFVEKGYTEKELTLTKRIKGSLKSYNFSEMRIDIETKHGSKGVKTLSFETYVSSRYTKEINKIGTQIETKIEKQIEKEERKTLSRAKKDFLQNSLENFSFYSNTVKYEGIDISERDGEFAAEIWEKCEEEEKAEKEREKREGEIERAEKEQQEQKKREWIENHGSEHLKKACLKFGHDCARKYVTERLSAEIPHDFELNAEYESIHDRSCPSEHAIEILESLPESLSDSASCEWMHTKYDEYGENEQIEVIVIRDLFYTTFDAYIFIN